MKETECGLKLSGTVAKVEIMKATTFKRKVIEAVAMLYRNVYILPSPSNADTDA